MPLNFRELLRDGNDVLNMPAIKISARSTDKFLIYDKKVTRMDRIAGSIYGDDAYWKVIMWANPEYNLEFDIPDGTVIRVPYPKKDVEEEIVQEIIRKKER